MLQTTCKHKKAQRHYTLVLWHRKSITREMDELPLLKSSNLFFNVFIEQEKRQGYFLKAYLTTYLHDAVNTPYVKALAKDHRRQKE